MNLVKTEHKYVDHVVGHGKVRPDPSKVEALLNWPVPKNLDEFRQLLGLANYFRKLDYHLITQLLHMTIRCPRLVLFMARHRAYVRNYLAARESFQVLVEF